MKNTILYITVICLFLISCNEKKPETVIKSDSVENMTIKIDTTEIIKKELKTANGKLFTIIESKPTYSMSNYLITGAGFENSEDTIKFYNMNPMTATLLSDINKDGFDELYIITKTTGDERFMDLMAFTSGKENNFREIIVEPVEPEDVKNDKMFDGYMGHDSIYIDGSGIIREFPVYPSSTYEKDKDQARRKIIYNLYPEGDKFKLDVTDYKDM
jgi:hypothetical protein